LNVIVNEFGSSCKMKEYIVVGGMEVTR